MTIFTTKYKADGQFLHGAIDNEDDTCSYQDGSVLGVTRVQLSDHFESCVLASLRTRQEVPVLVLVNGRHVVAVGVSILGHKWNDDFAHVLCMFTFVNTNGSKWDV